MNISEYDFGNINNHEARRDRKLLLNKKELEKLQKKIKESGLTIIPLRLFLNDRGLMGDGCINVPQIRGWMEEAGFDGFNEVEIFSDKYWATDQFDYLEKIK